MHLLVVDRDESTLDQISSLLSRSGHAISGATNGREALQLLENGSFSLVIAAREMPEVDGLELCRTIRSNRAGGYISVIILGEGSADEHLLAALSAGADGYMRKPLHSEELLLRVNSARRIASIGVRDTALFSLAQLAESRDPNTGQHLERMRNYCWVLARWLKRDYPEITEEYLDTLYQTSALHDIGKVAIPDSILLKPGGLTTEEFEVMKTHTTMGARTLRVASRQFPEVRYFTMAAEIALSHHESFDGSGYPEGLRGRDIPLCGRIVALADSYDALASRRPYKEALGHEESKDKILAAADRFDPLVLTGFLDLENEFIAIHDAFSDGGCPVGRNQADRETVELMPA
jgi:putative two-component system response regulator